MPVFPERMELVTPFGLAVCTERIDYETASFWVCWPKETGICFWFPNPEVRLPKDWSDGRYGALPFKLEPNRIEALDALGKFHTYWRENIKPGREPR
jgi:hypothetical protein